MLYDVLTPFRIVENNQVRRDLLTFLQNSVRDPKLQYEDVKVKLHACLRLIERIRAVIAEYGKENLIACLRKNIRITSYNVCYTKLLRPGHNVSDQQFVLPGIDERFQQWQGHQDACV